MGTVAKSTIAKYSRKLWSLIQSIHYGDLLIALVGLTLAVLLRWSLIQFKSSDFFDFTRVWYNFIKANGFNAFGENFANYNPPYLYLLYLVIRFLPDLPSVIATKIPSLIADFVCAYFASKIVGLKYPHSPIPMFSAFAILFAPTIVLNSAFWGQADSLYTTALVICLYFILRDKYNVAILFFGLAISFKLQAVFFLPFLTILLLRRHIPWRSFILVPVFPVLALLPSWLAGRSPTGLASIYYAQANQYEQLTMTAPSLYAWLPNSGKYFPYLYPAGLILAISVLFFYVVFISKTKINLSPSFLIELALLSVIIAPFFLPKMHDRYFYPSDVISIIFAFYSPAYFFVPIGLSTISFFAYKPTLFGTGTSLLPFLSLAMLAILVVLVQKIILRITQSQRTSAASEAPQGQQGEALPLQHPEP